MIVMISRLLSVWKRRKIRAFALGF